MPFADVPVSPIIAFSVIVYLALCFGIGLWALRRTRSSADFFVAGKSLGLVVMAIATFSSIMSGAGFVGGPGIVYESGMSYMWVVFVATIAYPLSWAVVGKRLRLLADTREILTLPDAVEARYGGRWPRLVMAVAILLGVLGYLGSQVLAIGVVLAAVLGIQFSTALLIGLGVLAFYSVAGGILASVYTDLFQGLLMLMAACAVFYFALQVGGGMSNVSTILGEMNPEFIGPWGARGPMASLSWYLLFGLGVMGQPQGITKFLMLRDVRMLRWGALLVSSANIVLALLWMGIGLVMRSLVVTGAESALGKADDAGPLFLLHHTPAIIAGVVFAALLAAIMSTADSFMNLGAAAVVRDIPIALRGRPLAHELFWSRLMTLVVLVVSALFGLYVADLVALVALFGWGTFAAAIVPALGIGLNWKRATASACVSSILVAVVLNLGLELASRNNIYSLPNGMSIGCFSLLASIVVFIVVSFLTSQERERRLPPDVQAVMEL